MTRADGKLDAIYIVRPQVERWPVALLRKYSDSLPVAKEELEKRERNDNSNQTNL